MDGRLLFLLKLLIGAVLLFLLFGTILPALGVNVALAERATWLATAILGVWYLRRLANAG